MVMREYKGNLANFITRKITLNYFEGFGESVDAEIIDEPLVDEPMTNDEIPNKEQTA